MYLICLLIYVFHIFQASLGHRRDSTDSLDSFYNYPSHVATTNHSLNPNDSGGGYLSPNLLASSSSISSPNQRFSSSQSHRSSVMSLNSNHSGLWNFPGMGNSTTQQTTVSHMTELGNTSRDQDQFHENHELLQDDSYIDQHTGATAYLRSTASRNETQYDEGYTPYDDREVTGQDFSLSTSIDQSFLGGIN